MLDNILKKEIIAPIVIVLVSITFYYILTRIVNRLYKLKITRQNDKKRKTIKSIINNIIKYFIIVVDLTMILEIYGIDTKSIIASLGVLSLVAGLALQDLLKDFIGGISILLEDQFSIGDVVEIGGFRGTIIKFGLKSTRIKAYTGEVKIVANRNVTELINYSLNDNIALLDIMISYDDDLVKAKKVLEDLCATETDKNTALYECLGVDELADSGIIIKIAITTNYENRLVLARNFKEKVKLIFDEENISIPFPQVVIHNGK